MTTQVMTVADNVLAFPKDGNGGRTTEFVVPKLSTAAEVFTATTGTATWGTANSAPNATGGGTSATSAGDYVTTSDGHWGVVVSGDATTVTVDRWRSVGQVGPGSVSVVPAAGSHIHIYSGRCQLVGSRRPSIKRILITEGTAADTVIITDAIGTTVFTYTIQTTLAAGATEEIDFTDGGDRGGRFTDGPFGIKLSHATQDTVVVYYEP